MTMISWFSECWRKCIRSWFILGWKEFWLPFHYRKTGCPGGRDFAWLTTFMAFMLTLVLLLLASREGLLNRFVDVLLGNIPGHGIPIRVTNNILRNAGVDAIDTSVLSEVRRLGESRIPGLDIYPYRSLEASLYPPVKFPDAQIWSNTREDGSKIGPDFDGWAVYAHDPLWKGPASSTAFPLEIILSRTLFNTYFNYDAYRQVLKTKLPKRVYEKLPDHFDGGLQKPLDELWLEVDMGFRWELLPFKVSWVERFPVIDNIAFVFPLTTYHALRAADDFPELRYFPEAYGQKGSRVKQILLELPSGQTEFISSDIDEFTAKLHGKTRRYRGDLLVAFEYPHWKFWIETYAEQYNLRYEVIESIPGDEIAYKEHSLILPCGRLPDEELRRIHCTSCMDDPSTPVHLDVTAQGRGFRHALVYVPERTFLSATVDSLTRVHDNALSIHPSYQDALNRFGFLSTMLAAMEKPYTWFLVIFLFSFLGIQIGTLIGHRRRRYGVLLAKGMEWWQLYFMLWTQILLSFILGFIVAFCLISGMRLFLQRAIALVADNYSQTLSIADLNLLPLTFFDYCIASLFILILAWGLTAIMLYFLPLRRHTHPAVLLH